MHRNDLLALIAILATVTYASTADYSTAQGTQQRYCKMVELHQDTRGEHGWPDYKNAYEESCNG